jgi:nicotinamide riboside kinase
MKIVITGPESSGKTTLALSLSKQLGFGCVLEMARQYLKLTNGNYGQNSLFEIALLQNFEEKYIQSRHSNYVCDTDLLTIIIWAEQKYDTADVVWYKWWDEHPPDLVLLCKPDIPWEPDPLRENPADRAMLFDIYVEKLEKSNRSFYIIEGSKEQRLAKAVSICDKWIVKQ